MNYDVKLIDKAKRSRCKICQDYISEDEAEGWKFHACKTSRGGYSFVHTRCWKGEKEVVNAQGITIENP